MAETENGIPSPDRFGEGRSRFHRAGFVFCILVYILVVIGYAYWIGRRTQRELLEGVDQRLLVAALSIKHMLADDFHDRAVTADAIPYAEEMKNRRAVNSFTAETRLKYLYTLVEKDGRFYFSAPTVTEEEARQQRRWYFYPYDDAPEAFKTAFSEGTVQYTNYADRWGTFRSIALPQVSPGGRRYLSCADYDITYVEDLLQESYLEAALAACLFILLPVPLVLLFRGMYQDHSDGLRAVNEILSQRRARLEEQVAERTAQLEVSNRKILHQNRYLEALHRISLGLIQRLNTDDLLQEIIRQASELGDTPHTYIYLYDPDAEELELKFGRGFYKALTGYRMQPGQGLTGTVFSSGKPLHIEDYENWNKRDPNPIFDTLCSVLGIPLVSGEQVFGVIGLGYFDEIRRPADAIFTVMNHFAELAAIAIDNARLYTTVEEELRRRKELEADRLTMEKRLFQAEKIEAVGTLAGGIAHDFNNLLMGIQGRVSLMSMELRDSPLFGHIESIEEYVQSAADLTQQLLGYARGGKYEVTVLDLNELVSASLDLFARTRKEIRIHRKMLLHALFIEADRRQIQQALLNILVNAWQAMPDGGDLSVATSASGEKAAASGPDGGKPGRFAVISVTDSGTGMDDTTKSRIFDPFFTTKDKSRGTGMGLASADGIVRNHGGRITVESKLGRGSTFHIHLPLLEITMRGEEAETEVIPKGSGTVLLVDDEEIIQDVGPAMLEKMGYRVMVVANGEDALHAVAEYGGRLDLVILDLIMPGMDGGTAFDRIREMQPEMPVLLSSGYAIDDHAEEILKRGANGFIQKPFNLSTLSCKVREVLKGPNPA